MVAEVVDEKARVKVGQSALAQARKVDVPPRGSRVVFLLVVGAARTTAVVKLAFDATSPGKGPVTRILGREEPTSRARKVGHVVLGPRPEAFGVELRPRSVPSSVRPFRPSVGEGGFEPPTACPQSRCATAAPLPVSFRL